MQGLFQLTMSLRAYFVFNCTLLEVNVKYSDLEAYRKLHVGCLISMFTTIYFTTIMLGVPFFQLFSRSLFNFCLKLISGHSSEI